MDKLIFNKRLGEFVRLKRMQLKLSQPQLADRVGLDYQYISRVERGLISPTLHWLSNLSEAFEMSPTDFINELLAYTQANTASIKS
jgi:transcriptional regulator with XRE-family HTH domain